LTQCGQIWYFRQNTEVVITAIFNPAITNLNINEVKRYAGLQTMDFSTEILLEACRAAKILIKPQAVWHIYPYHTQTATILAPSPLTLQGNSIKQHLAKTVSIAVLTVTIGEKLETEAADCFSQGEYTKGFLLDAAGTTAVEAAADQACRIIASEAKLLGCQLTTRFSPGYGDFALNVQQAILDLAGGANINVYATATAMLLPRKSITALIGLMPYENNAPSAACPINTCGSCKQINCIARKENTQ
jgi:hypothetical protein